MKKINWYGFIPMGVLFLSPWAHWIIYHNLLLAWPEMNHETAHTLGIGGAIAAFFATCMIVFGP